MEGRSSQEVRRRIRGEGDQGSSPDFVPPAERVAVFDNDGTLWAEQPIYLQFAFALDRVKTLAPALPRNGLRADDRIACLLDDRAFERLNPEIAGRPDLMFGRKTLVLYPRMTNMTKNGFINTKAVSYTITEKPWGQLFPRRWAADVGMDAWSPVTDDYDPWDNQFTGTIQRITSS